MKQHRILLIETQVATGVVETVQSFDNLQEAVKAGVEWAVAHGLDAEEARKQFKQPGSIIWGPFRLSIKGIFYEPEEQN